VGVTRGAGVGVPVVVGVGDGVTDGSDGVGVAVGVGVGVKPGCAQYLPPVFRAALASYPPQTIISLPVQTAVWDSRAAGAFVVLVANQVLVLG
jgi:hypothetical protein